ncbi:MAG: hypothetical protein JRN54_09615 [Nitrososphaerota archaeon]|nr:hypothetical protein [Nitrososphaerota archaeon]
MPKASLEWTSSALTPPAIASLNQAHAGKRSLGAPEMNQSRRRKIALVVGLVMMAAFVFGAPVSNATIQGGVAVAGNPASGYIHFHDSLSCKFSDFGDMYWQGSLSFGCFPLVA